MFDPNEPASPVTEFEVGGTCKEYRGLTKFQQCAKDFTAAWIQALSVRYREQGWSDGAANYEAARLGCHAAEEFCRQMEEREK